MFFEEAIVKRLKADTTISNLVGGRIFPLFVPQGVTRPTITYEIDGVDRTPRESGGLVEVFFVFEIQADADDYGVLKDVSEAIRQSLDSFKGNTIDGFEIRGVWIEDETSGHVRPTDGTGLGYLNYQVDVKIFYRETVLSNC